MAIRAKSVSDTVGVRVGAAPLSYGPAERELGHSVQQSGASRIATLVFLQMLPATLLTPAVRPLVAGLSGGSAHVMHAFMALNMLGAVLVVPWLGAHAERLPRTQRLIGMLAILDALLLFSMCTNVSVLILLILRTCEGAAHVSATSLLLAEAAAISRREHHPRGIGMSGAALMIAVGVGSAMGGQLVALDRRAPFWAASALQLAVALAILTGRDSARATSAPATTPRAWPLPRDLVVPIMAVFVGRFTVGCLVVTFALFCHHAHAASDRAIGWLLSLLTLPFALSMYPVSQLSRRISRANLMAVGAAVYALALLSLAYASWTWLPWVMVVAGIASACLFAPCLCYAATLGGERKEHAMSLVNTAGCLGMLIGPACAGVVSSLAGLHDPVAGYRAVFSLAAAGVGLWLLVSGRWLRRRFHAESIAHGGH